MRLNLLLLMLILVSRISIAGEDAILETARRTHRPVSEIQEHHLEGCATGITTYMNICAEYHYVKSDLKLNQTYTSLLAKLKGKPVATSQLVKAQRAWVTFRDLTCEFESNGWSGGSGRSMVVLTCKSVLTESRTKTLQEYLECTEGCPGDGG